MAKASDELGAVLQEVFRAEKGDLDKAETEDLQSLLAGVFGHKMDTSRVRSAVNGGDWYQVEGMLRRMMCDIDASSGASTVSVASVSSANAVVNLDVSVLLDIQQTIDGSDELTEEQRKDLAIALREIVAAAQEQRPKGVAQKLKEWLEVGANTATVAQVLGPLLVQVGSMLMS